MKKQSPAQFWKALMNELGPVGRAQLRYFLAARDAQRKAAMKKQHRDARKQLRLDLASIEDRIAAIRRCLADTSTSDEGGTLCAIECDMHNIAEIADHFARTWFKKK